MNRAVENAPHSKTTHGGDGCFAAMLRAVVSQQPSSASTFFRTVLPVGSPEESRNTSTVISRGSGPRNSGLLPLRTAGLGVNFQLAPRLMVSCAGLKSKWNVRMSPPGVVLLPRGGSWMERRRVPGSCPRPCCSWPWGPSLRSVRWCGCGPRVSR